MKFCVISLLATIVLERISYFPVSEITLGLWTIILGTGPWFDPSHVSVDCHCGKAWNLKKNLGTVILHTFSFLYWACGQYIVAALHNTTDILPIVTFPAQYNLVVSTFRTSPVFPVSLEQLYDAAFVRATSLCWREHFHLGEICIFPPVSNPNKTTCERRRSSACDWKEMQ